MQRIGVFGASFNPPTLGHFDALKQALPHFDEILLVPSLSHPFGKNLAPIVHRLAMLEIFLNDLQSLQLGHNVKISLIEQSMQMKGQAKEFIYTYDVLTELSKLYQSQHQSVSLRFILGPDNNHPDVWHKFYRYQEIEQNWPLFVAKENLPIHSTMVREICMRYRDEPQKRRKELIELVGEPIANYIEQHKLYREKESAYG